MLSYPVSIDMIIEFEKVNDIPLNVFELIDNKDELVEIAPIYTFKIVSNNKPINLLLISDDEKNHYVYIKNLNSLLKRNTNSPYACEKCN
jgi:hypothetical protein